MEVWVTVTVGTMEHYGTRRRGERFRCSRQIAEKLAARDLVSIEGEAESENPTGADGEKSSASPADQASAEQTSTPSGTGETAEAAEGQPEPGEPADQKQATADQDQAKAEEPTGDKATNSAKPGRRQSKKTTK